MSNAAPHLWLSAPRDAVEPFAAADLGPALTVDADRRLRGPYTGTGSLLRALVPRLKEEQPELLHRHAVEILLVAPETEPLVGPLPGTLTMLAVPEERTRWYSRLRTRRIAHGLIDLLRARAGHSPGLTLVWRNLDRADPTDLEFLEIALRRLDPAGLRIVATSPEPVPPLPLRAAVDTHAVRRTLAAALPIRPEPGVEQDELAQAYVAADCAADLPAARAAYLALNPDRRAELHDRRADELEALGEFTLRLGAIPYHRERGSSPEKAGWRACRDAAKYCVDLGFYQAGLDLADRMTALTDPADHADQAKSGRYWAAQCLQLLDRPAETEQLYLELLSRTTSRQVHQSLHYALSMIYTRVYGPADKDHVRAMAHINTAIAMAEALPDQVERAFHSVFMNNGKALVELHLRNLPAALELVTAGIERLDRELRPDQHQLHRSVLHNNRGNVLAALGRGEEALAEFDHVIAADPNYPEYRFERGNLHFQLGRPAEALADYEEAIRLGPPFPEAYWNRGNVKAELGDWDGAVADLRYVLDLEPDFTEARISLASLLLDREEPAEAAREAELGLVWDPKEARLHCTYGLALVELDHAEEASRAFGRALELDPALTQARANRAFVAHAQGRPADAVADLTAAVEQQPADSDLRYNLGFLLEELERWDEAAVEYTAALEHAEDRTELLFRRGRCHARQGDRRSARMDLRELLADGEAARAEELRLLIGE